LLILHRIDDEIPGICKVQLSVYPRRYISMRGMDAAKNEVVARESYGDRTCDITKDQKRTRPVRETGRDCRLHTWTGYFAVWHGNDLDGEDWDSWILDCWLFGWWTGVNVSDLPRLNLFLRQAAGLVRLAADQGAGSALYLTGATCRHHDFAIVGVELGLNR
jgi:hypothetical protein